MADIELPEQSHDVAELLGSLSEAAQALFAAGSVSGTLQRVVDLAVTTIEGCDFAGIFVLDHSEIRTPVHTDPIVVAVDALQHQSGEGPCLAAISEGGMLYAEDLAEDPRWPCFGPGACAIGVRSALAFRLSANGVQGALNLYATFPQAFGSIDRANGQILATLSGLALSAAQAHEESERQKENWQRSLITREIIGQAMGILMERERITGEQAFVMLRRASQQLNIKLRDVARDLIETGEDPTSGPTNKQ